MGQVVKQAAEVRKVVFACEAGMGSSLIGANQLKRKLKDAGLTVEVAHAAVHAIPKHADVNVAHAVAMLHGTFDDKTLILSTGVAVASFPRSATLDGANVAHLFVGIAAIREEYIGVLANRARVLEDEAVSNPLWSTASAADVY